MIELPTYDIAPPDEAVRTPAIEKPEPESEPLDILEMDRILPQFDKGILFSGGDDSLVLTHKAFQEGWADVVIHLATGTSIPENIDYVRRVCAEFCWPLIIIKSPMPFKYLSMRYGFAGPSAHTLTYHALKGRQLSYINTQTDGDLKFLSGVRTDESTRRMENITAEVEYTDDSHNFDGWWISPLMDLDNAEIMEYRKRHDLPRNPVAKRIDRSGDCNCLSFGHRDSELIDLQAHYPDMAEWLLNVEKQVAEYRGRVFHLEEEFPAVHDAVQEQRKKTRPHPMRLTVLREAYPEVYDEIVAVSVDNAISRGKTRPTSFIGHGGLSSKELRNHLADADIDQETLCQNCGGPADGLAASVKRTLSETQSDTDPDPSPTQTKLPTDG